MIELHELLPEGTTMYDELVIETDAQIAQNILGLAKSVMEKWAGEIFTNVLML
jgi:hypothetical protein